MKSFVEIALLLVIVVSAVLHLMCWFAAYHNVPRIDKWSQQFAALSAWWVFDKNLLPPEKDHWRIKALWSAATGTGATGLFWYLRY